MSEIVIADTSCLIVLEKINRMDLLRALFTEITVTPEVQSEYGNAMPDWISVEEVQDKKRQQILAFALDIRLVIEHFV